MIGGILGKLVGFRDKRESDWDFERIFVINFNFLYIILNNWQLINI